MGERLGQERQRPEGARHTDSLAGGPEVESHAPAQPGGARAESAVPAAAGVEIADQIEEAGGGGLEVRRQLGDLVAQPVQLGDVIRGGDDSWRMDSPW